MRLSDFFQIEGNQSYLDFVDVPLDTDIELFIDPYSVASAGTPFAVRCHLKAKAFFQEVLDSLRAGDREKASDLVDALREDNRTRLGYSSGSPNGSGLGPDRAEPFLNCLERSEAFASGKVEDLDELALLVDRVDKDIVSDMMTNILHAELVEYTAEQCELLGIPRTHQDRLRVWRPGEGWTTEQVMLPTDGEKPILLVPRVFVKKQLSLRPGNFISSLLDQFESGSESAMQSLSRMLQEIPIKPGGKVDRARVRDDLGRRGPAKRTIAELANRDSLNRFKEQRRKKHQELSASEIESMQNDRKFVDFEAVLDETIAAAANSTETMGLARQLTGVMLASLHPVFQHPAPVETGIAGTVGVRFANMSENPFLRACRRRNPNVLVITVSKQISSELLETLPLGQLMSDAEAGAVIIVGTGLDPTLTKNRKKLGTHGVVLTTVPQLGEALKEGASPELVADVIAKLAGAVS